MDSRRWKSPLGAVAHALVLFSLLPVAAADAQDIWLPEAGRHAIQDASDGAPMSAAVRSFSASALERALRAVPVAEVGYEGAIRLELPTPDGELVDFVVVERPTLSPDLQTRRPDLRTYAGFQASDPRRQLRLTHSPGVVIATVLGPDGWNLDSTRSESPTTVHLWRSSDDPSAILSQCDALIDVMGDLPLNRRALTGSHGDFLRTYGFAMTGTGEFALYHGGVANAETQIAALVNLANAFLERELSVRLQLVGINVYADPATDPFTNGLVPSELSLDENQAALDRVIGRNGYELGHVVSRYESPGWRGLAQPAAQCDRDRKARGATYAAAPTASGLLEGIMHEVGHQLGALHSFNGTGGSCGANRVAAWAYEIASGVSWMGYTGICGTENVNGNTRIQMYNAGSIESIVAQMDASTDCGVLSPTGNGAPFADAGPDYTIPRGTAFVLDGSGSSDPDPDGLTFSWEQYDLGPPSPPYGPEQGPLFRNFAPTPDALRSVPSYSAYRRGIPAPYEFLPTVDRILTFRLVVRDGRAGGGGVAWDTTLLTVAGPAFRILDPNGGESYESGANATVDWDLGGGSVADSVRILFSPDGGVTWSEVQATTPNDGNHTVAIPCGATAEAKLRIEPTDNIFFDISDGDFAVTADVTPPVVVCPPPFAVAATGPEGIDKDDPALAEWIASVQAIDTCDPDPVVTLTTTQIIPIGTNTVAFIARDAAVNIGVCTTELTVTSATSSPADPARTTLLGVQPNPLNPTAVISFRLATRQMARLAIYDLRGRLVAVLRDGTLAPGTHDVRWDGSGVPGGVYIARLATADGVFTHRLALVK